MKEALWLLSVPINMSAVKFIKFVLFDCLLAPVLGIDSALSNHLWAHLCVYERWAHMHHFLYVSVWTTKI